MVRMTQPLDFLGNLTEDSSITGEYVLEGFSLHSHNLREEGRGQNAIRSPVLGGWLTTILKLPEHRASRKDSKLESQIIISVMLERGLSPWDHRSLGYPRRNIGDWAPRTNKVAVLKIMITSNFIFSVGK